MRRQMLGRKRLLYATCSYATSVRLEPANQYTYAWAQDWLAPLAFAVVTLQQVFVVTHFQDVLQGCWSGAELAAAAAEM